MLVNAGQARSGDAVEGLRATFADAPVFADAVHTLVFGQAPRLFAILHEVGHREDAWVAAWGMAFDDHVEVVDSDGRCRMALSSAERACDILGCDDNATAHLLWLDGRASGAMEAEGGHVHR
ncbi:hypothetical protein ACTG9Q_12275 [Actinokineospora sp. 24-640]